MRKSYIRSQKAKNRTSRRAHGATAAKSYANVKSMFDTPAPPQEGVHVPLSATGIVSQLGRAGIPMAVKVPIVSSKREESSSSTPEESGGPLAGLTVDVIPVDEGGEAYLFSHAGERLGIPIEQFITARQTAMVSISRLGVRLAHRRAQNALDNLLEEAVKREDVIAVTRLGYDRRKGNVLRPQYYAFGDGTIYRSREAPDCVVCFPVQKNFGRRGSRKVQEKAIASVVRNQAAPSLVFFVGLAPVLQPYAKEAGLMIENVLVEMVGPTSTYKSNLTTLVAGSIWGGNPNSKLGYAHGWNATANRLEELCALHNNSLLVLDEATMAAPNAKARGEVILNVTHRLSSGQTKGRLGEDTANFQLLALSNSNESLLSILSEASEVERASEVRLIAIKCPSRETGYFDSIPDGYGSIEAAMSDLRSACGENFGHIARRFIREVLKWSERDHQGLIARIRGHMQDFLSAAGAEPGTAASDDLRRAKVFALAHAASELALETGVLRKKLWGDTRKPLLRAWRKYGQRRRSSIVDDQLGTFLADPQKRLVDVTDGSKPEITDKQLREIDGFIYRGRGNELLLCMTPAAMRAQLAFSSTRLKTLKGRGILRCNKKLKRMVRVRSVDGIAKLEAFYAFKIAAIPPHARPYSNGTKEGRSPIP